jgi:fatty acid synthase, animal type
MHEMIIEDVKRGIVKPIKANVFEANEIEKAFRFMASGKHIGKVVLKIRENPEDEFSLPIEVCSRVYFDSNESYILIGGLGGFGLELADWMILRGCRKLLLSSRRGISNSYQSWRIR